MSAAGKGQPVRLARRRLGRIVVVVFVLTVGVQVGDAAFHVVQDVGEDLGRLRIEVEDRGDRPSCLTVPNLTTSDLADRLLKFFRLDRADEPEHIAQN